jgi:enoyl-CoA hydratase/carnithine racemase
VGADLSGRDILRPGSEPDREPPAPRQILWPSAVRKPVVAALHGHAIGIGMTFSLHCDVRFVAEDAKVGLPFVRRGVVPEANANWLLPRTVGLTAALDLVLTGRTLLGREAAELGLCYRALPAGEVLDAATRWVAQVVADGAPLALGLAKRLLWDSLASGPDEAWEKERTAFEACAGSTDAAEGVAAFLERRPARWQEQVSVAWPRVLDAGRD